MQGNHIVKQNCLISLSYLKSIYTQFVIDEEHSKDGFILMMSTYSGSSSSFTHFFNVAKNYTELNKHSGIFLIILEIYPDTLAGFS